MAICRKRGAVRYRVAAKEMRLMRSTFVNVIAGVFTIIVVYAFGAMIHWLFDEVSSGAATTIGLGIIVLLLGIAALHDRAQFQCSFPELFRYYWRYWSCALRRDMRR